MLLLLLPGYSEPNGFLGFRLVSECYGLNFLTDMATTTYWIVVIGYGRYRIGMMSYVI